MTHTSPADATVGSSSRGEFMLTLCPLASPIRVRMPESDPLRQFKFFMSRARREDGTEQLRLHMGYFNSLAEARQWAQNVRARFPAATAERVPLAILQQRDAATALTDSQVLRVLESRRATPVEAGKEKEVSGISVVGPADTQVRRALKDAVAEDEPVSFAVQLFESTTDIDLANVPSLSIFRAYKLYKTSITRADRTTHHLRLGFFKDAISAKQVAYYVRPHFADVAVVPVTDAESAQGAANRIDPAQLSDDFQRSIDQQLQNTAPPPSTSQTTGPRPALRLEPALDMLADSELWNEPDSHTETGVRHLKVEVQRKKGSR